MMPAMPSARAILKQTQLDRGRRLASTLLCASLALLVVSVLYQSLWPWLRWLQAFAEASAIGAMSAINCSTSARPRCSYVCQGANFVRLAASSGKTGMSHSMRASS